MALTNFIKNMFMTPGQKKNIEDAYYSKMFPFGAKQQEWENKAIDVLFKGTKNISTIKYLCLVRREMYIDHTVNNDLDEKITKEYIKLVKRMKISEGEEKIIDALARLEAKAKDYDELPTLEQIKEEAEKWT